MGLRTGFSVVLYSLFAQEGSREAETAQRSRSGAPKALILGVVFSKTSFKNQITSYPFKITPVSSFAYSISKENPDLHLRIGKSVSVRSLPGLSVLARSCFLIFLGRSQFDKCLLRNHSITFPSNLKTVILGIVQVAMLRFDR